MMTINVVSDVGDRDLTETEQLVAAVWQEVTGRQYRPSDNFFKYGGDSLAASKVIARLWSAVSVRATLAGIFANPVLEDFARYITSLQTCEVDDLEIQKVRRDRSIAMSPAQEAAVLFRCAEERGERPRSVGFVSLVAEIAAPVSDATVVRALRVLTERHESLRMGLTVDGVHNSGQLTVAPAVEPRLEIRDCRDVGPEQIDQLLEDQHEALSAVPLDTAAPPMWRACLYRLSPSHAFLMLIIDHFIADGIAVEILFDELGELLGRRRPDAAVADPDFLDWVHWRRRRFAGPAREELARFWRSYLAGTGPFPSLALPTPTSQPEHANHAMSLRLKPRKTAELLEMAAHRHATPFLACLAAIAVAWERTRGVRDIVVQTPAANRLEPRYARVVGCMAHTIPIRITLRPGATLSEALESVQVSALAAMGHQDMRLPEIAAEFHVGDHAFERPPRLFFGFEQIDDGTRPITGGLMRRVHFPIRAADRARDRAIAQRMTMSTPGVSCYGDISEGCLGLGVAVDPRETAVELVAQLHSALRGVLEELP